VAQCHHCGAPAGAHLSPTCEYCGAITSTHARAMEKAATVQAILADRNQNGVPDILEGGDGRIAPGRHAFIDARHLPTGIVTPHFQRGTPPRHLPMPRITAFETLLIVCIPVCIAGVVLAGWTYLR